VDREDWTPDQFEQEARRQGWNPEADIPEEKKVDAKTFVERGDNIASRLKEDRDSYREELESVKRTTEEFKQFMNSARERDKQEYEQRIAALKTQREEAINEGDGQRFTMVNDQIEGLQQQQPQGPPPEVIEAERAFHEANPWYNADPTLQEYADRIAERLNIEGYMGNAYNREMGERVRMAFPEKFENPARQTAPVESVGGDRTVSSSDAQTYDSLPADARAKCDEFVSQGLMTKEEYVEAYDWE